MENRKIWIVGSPGSGKTVLSKKLSLETGIPVFSLDEIRWETGWKIKDIDVYKEELKEILKLDSWIIDGYYNEKEDLLQFSEVIIYIEIPLRKKIFRVIRRTYKRIKLNIAVCNGNIESWSFFWSINGMFLYTIKMHYLYKYKLKKYFNENYNTKIKGL
ncbi:kinase [Staphylococcus ursi]|uniref:kinase n=1 Tax=Staphylococcus sp. MI 10-1553 TaxID=1912064 RepID=UPI00139934D0|nr:kinase [Staphylococcus sp. MI 10-1553]QHW38315.1 kinase [Staphylococcus sp. MI 10-1553]